MADQLEALNTEDAATLISALETLGAGVGMELERRAYVMRRGQGLCVHKSCGQACRSDFQYQKKRMVQILATVN